MIAARRNWWESPYLWIALAALSALPFAFVKIPPLTDIPYHIARFHVFLTLENSPFLQQYFRLNWGLVGNLGVDLLVGLLGPFFGVELATRIVVASIPPLTIAGIYSLNRSMHGCIQPASLLALPLSYNFPFIFGLVNFSLSAALAMLVLSLWITTRERSWTLRFPLFVVLGFITWLAHTVGWGLLGLGVFGFEVVRAVSTRGLGPSAVFRAGLETYPFLGMIALTTYWHAGSQSKLGLQFPQDFLVEKIIHFSALFRQHDLLWDGISTIVYFLLFLALLFYARGRASTVGILIFALFMMVYFFAPTAIFGSGFIDHRVLPYAFIILPLALAHTSVVHESTTHRRVIALLAAIAVIFFLARTAHTTVIWSSFSTSFETRLKLLANIKPETRVFNLMVESCGKKWSRTGRPDHLQDMALVRRGSLVNGLFQGEGFNQVKVLFGSDGAVNANMQPIVRDANCPVVVTHWPTFQTAVKGFPRAMFDYLWIASDDPIPDFDDKGLSLIDAVGNDRLYYIEQGR